LRHEERHHVILLARPVKHLSKTLSSISRQTLETELRGPGIFFKAAKTAVKIHFHRLF
jgi:hypothetical protein